MTDPVTPDSSTVDGPVLTVWNAHTPGCGDPPALEKRRHDGRYAGFFTNQEGEQWVLTVDMATQTGELRGGDLGWDTVLRIEGDRLADVILSREEDAWLRLCWRAATGRELLNPPVHSLLQEVG